MNTVLSYFTNNIMLTCILVGSAIMTIWWLKFQKQLNMKWYMAPLLAIGHFVLGAVALKIWGTFESVLGFDKNATMKLYGGLFLLPPVYFLGAKLTKRDYKLILDISAVCCALGFIGRGSCIVNGCCQGALYLGGRAMHMPLNEIELASTLLFVICFWQPIYKRKTKGFAFPIFSMFYGGMRFILEWFRIEYTTVGFLHLAHIWSLLAIAIGAGVIYLLRKTTKTAKFAKISRVNRRESKEESI